VSVDEHFGIRIDFEKSCPPNDTDENAPATAYLIQQRGLSKEVLEGYDYFYVTIQLIELKLCEKVLDMVFGENFDSSPQLTPAHFPRLGEPLRAHGGS